MSNSYNYVGQVAVITGGCNGIGAAVADRLANSGAKVMLWDIDISSPESRVKALSADVARWMC